MFGISSFSSLLRHRGAGYLVDPFDSRDRPLSLLGIGSPPPRASVRSAQVLPKQQGGTMSCVGMALAQAVRTAYHQLGLECPELSALALYFWSRALWNGQTRDGGTYWRTTIQAAQKLGCPSEAKWSFYVTRVNTSPPPTALFDGAKRRGVRGYYRIPNGDVDGVRRAIAAGYPVVGGWLVDRDFLRNDGPGMLTPLALAEGMLGHAMLIEEYSGSSFGLLNSYGVDWRDGGRVLATEEFVAQGADLWAIDVAGNE